MELFKSERFKQEIQQIYDKIKDIPEENSTKIEIKSLTSQLLNEVRKLDVHHDQIHLLGKLSQDNVNDSRVRIVEYRKKIFELLKVLDS